MSKRAIFRENPEAPYPFRVISETTHLRFAHPLTPTLSRSEGAAVPSALSHFAACRNRPPGEKCSIQARDGHTLRKWFQRPRFYLPLLILVAAGWTWTWGARLGGWVGRLNGSHTGVIVVGDRVSLIVGVRGGWPSRDWIEREHLRAAGNGDSLTSYDTTFVGFGVLTGERSWNGNQRIVVWHKAIALPWWYLLLLVAAAGPLEGFVRWLWLKRRSERRRRAGLCPACGYNLTGNISGVCPECGEMSPQ